MRLIAEEECWPNSDYASGKWTDRLVNYFANCCANCWIEECSKDWADVTKLRTKRIPTGAQGWTAFAVIPPEWPVRMGKEELIIQ